MFLPLLWIVQAGTGNAAIMRGWLRLRWGHVCFEIPRGELTDKLS